MENNKNLDLEKSIELINNSFFSEAINLLKNLIKQIIQILELIIF